MLYIVTASRGSMGGEVASVIKKLEDEAGAELIRVHPGPGPRGVFVSKFQTARHSMSPRLLTLRNRWAEEDSVLVVGWYLIPILMLLAVRLLRRPRRLVSLGAFMHNAPLRQLVNQILRLFKIDGLEFIVMSDAERANLVDVVGISSERVHRVVYRVTWSDEGPPERHGDYVFTGGCTHRDYATFFAAVAPLPYDVIAVASQFNDVSDPPPNVDLRIASPEDEFEQLVAGCSLLVLPLLAGGEACGQSVLLSGIRHKRPVVATRHDALIDYLGPDYPGFVTAQDPYALRGAIARALSDQRFRDSLLDRVHASAQMLRDMGDLDQDFLRILAPRDGRSQHWRERAVSRRLDGTGGSIYARLRKAGTPTKLRRLVGDRAVIRVQRLVAAVVRRNLTALAIIYRSDKASAHRYTRQYERHLGHLRRHPVRLLEIGIGGDESLTWGGASLRMWRDYFRRGEIHGLDINEKRIDEPRIRIHRGDQSDEDFIRNLGREQGPFDIIVDDGSHRNEHVRASFAALFHHYLAPGGVYVIEDMATAYDPHYGGGPPGHPGTSVELVKSLIDDVNVEPRAVAAMHVYEQIAFIEKSPS